MRPVVKLAPGTYPCGNGRLLTIKTDYHPNYRDAKPHLVFNLGCMCSYCEKAFDDERELAVEHIQAKKYKDENGNYPYAALETKWENFLLSCTTCNGNDNKGNKNVVYGECHLPHLNNTFLSFQYKAGGVVNVNPNLTGKSLANAEALHKLVGLNKGPMDSKSKDRRWFVRTEKWDLAMRYLYKYENKKVDIETIIDLVKGHGCWSIWFTIFKEHPEVRKELIEQFPGTAKECFDSANNYEPIPRNPKNTIDPV